MNDIGGQKNANLAKMADSSKEHPEEEKSEEEDLEMTVEFNSEEEVPVGWKKVKRR